MLNVDFIYDVFAFNRTRLKGFPQGVGGASVADGRLD